MKKLLVVLLLLILSSWLFSTDVSGQQSGVWSLANSPYRVIGDIDIPDGLSLTIEAGVNVYIIGDYQITAYGTISAIGTSVANINFKAEGFVTTTTWQSIRLEHEGTDVNEFEYCQFSNAESAIKSIDSPLTVTNCHFINNGEGLYVFAIGNPNAPQVTIEDSIIENSMASGISIVESTNVLIENNILRGNGTGSQFRGAIQMQIQSEFINSNLISGNYGGIYITTGAEPIIGAPEMNIPYAGGLNTIRDNIDANGTNNSVILNTMSSNITILAKNNYWGTEDEDVIAETITDGNDDSSLGMVEFLPLAVALEPTLNIRFNYTGDWDFTNISLSLINLETLEEISISDTFPLNTDIAIEMDDSGDYTIKGYLYGEDGDAYAYSGSWSEPEVIHVDNISNDVIELNIVEGHAPYQINTYSSFNWAGETVLPIAISNSFPAIIRQLVYENDDDEIMLLGYQNLTGEGWVNNLLPEEVLFFNNLPTTPGESWTNHKVILEIIGGTYIVYETENEYIGSYSKEIEGEEIEVKVVKEIAEDPSGLGIIYENWYEYAAQLGAIAFNNRGFNKTINQYETTSLVATESERLIELADMSEFIVPRVLFDDAPFALKFIESNFYWNPISINYTFNNIYRFKYEGDFIENGFIDIPLEADLNLALPDDLSGSVDFYIVGVQANGTESEPSNIITLDFVSNGDTNIEEVNFLGTNYPNPFNPETTISYNVAKDNQKVEIVVYNIIGQKVKTLVNSAKQSGEHTVVWNGRNEQGNQVGSGIFFYKIKSGSYSKTKKMVLLK
ncbi:MAG: hypothetical protein B6226_04350 [Candidatus Cloacimonetes bacterium 4572_65]|nr:MAG: hypothetical protein B6226_04350 [Candidatus Cloacimonetes bacterium 4572_65]